MTLDTDLDLGIVLTVGGYLVVDREADELYTFTSPEELAGALVGVLLPRLQENRLGGDDQGGNVPHLPIPGLGPPSAGTDMSDD